MRVIIWRRSRVKDCYCKLVKVALLILLLVVLVVPVRNTIFSFVLPGMWMEHSTSFLLKMVLDFQSFPVDETPIGHSPVQLHINFDDIDAKFTSQQRTFHIYHERVSQLQEMSKTDTAAQAELNKLLKFQPLMSEHDRAIAMFTLDVFIKACEAANLTYFLVSGSILGAMRHHGMIPWDDDIDIIMNANEWRKIRNVLGNIQGFELFSPHDVQWKFYMKSLPKGNRPFKWPNIDIFFFNEDDTHVWSQTFGTKASLCNKKSDVFPLKRRKFERWYVPVPRDINLIVTAEFGDINSVCKTGGYIHRTNDMVPSSQLSSIDCKKLHDVFPFVFRDASKPGTVVEVRKIGVRHIENVTISVDD